MTDFSEPTMIETLTANAEGLLALLGQQALYASVLAVLVFALIKVAKFKNPVWSYGLWTLVLVRLVLPVDLASPVSLRAAFDWAAGKATPVAEQIELIPLEALPDVAWRSQRETQNPRPDLAALAAMPVEDVNAPDFAAPGEIFVDDSKIAYNPFDSRKGSVSSTFSRDIANMAGNRSAVSQLEQRRDGGPDRLTGVATRTPTEIIPGIDTLLPSATPRTPGIIQTLAGLPWALMLSGMWLIGVITLTARTLVRLRVYHRELKSAQTIDTPEAIAQVARWSERFGVKRKVRLVTSPAALTPFTGGIIRPYIYIPGYMLSASPVHLNAVIGHEMAHISRLDDLWIKIEAVIQILFFFLPFAWLAGKRIGDARETICDRMVVSSGWVSSRDYLLGLVTALKGAREQHGVPLAAMGEAKKHLIERIMQLKGRDASRPLAIIPVTVAIGCLAITLLPMAARGDDPSDALDEKTQQAGVLVAPNGRIMLAQANNTATLTNPLAALEDKPTKTKVKNKSKAKSKSQSMTFDNNFPFDADDMRAFGQKSNLRSEAERERHEEARREYEARRREHEAERREHEAERRERDAERRERDAEHEQRMLELEQRRLEQERERLERAQERLEERQRRIEERIRERRRAGSAMTTGAQHEENTREKIELNLKIKRDIVEALTEALEDVRDELGDFNINETLDRALKDAAASLRAAEKQLKDVEINIEFDSKTEFEGLDPEKQAARAAEFARVTGKEA
ncbi:MAG: M56 family metallopeptidase, partial [Pseudomonadota bacterium]